MKHIILFFTIIFPSIAQSSDGALAFEQIDTKSEQVFDLFKKLTKTKPKYRPLALLCGDVFHTKCINS